MASTTFLENFVASAAAPTRMTARLLCAQLIAFPLIASGLNGMPNFTAAADENSLEAPHTDSVTVDANGVATVAAPLGLKTISLQKQYVPIKKANKTIAYKTAYFGTVYVGFPKPQEFTAVFDTGSGHLIVPGDSCTSEACLTHRRYNSKESSTAVEIEFDGKVLDPESDERDSVAIAFGTGEVQGEFVEDKVCLGVSAEGVPEHCTTLRVVVATEMTTDPFGQFAFDGVMGLGLEALLLKPEFSFFGQMAAQSTSLQPQFSVFLAQDDEGENTISFGGYDPAKATSEIQWSPVAMPELGYWQVHIKNVRIGDHVLEDCADGTCRAILDTGTSLLSAPRSAVRTMHRFLARQVPEELEHDASNVDCRQVPGKALEFDLVGGGVVSLGVRDYSRPTPFNMTLNKSTTEAKLFCRSLLLPMDMQPPLGPKVFIWGEPVLRKYYTVFDIAKKQIGLSVARQAVDEGARGLPAVGAPPPGSRVAGSPLRAGATSEVLEV